jgi:alanyl-tRNA synthetase
MPNFKIQQFHGIGLMLFISLFLTNTQSQIAAQQSTQQPANNPPAEANENCPEAEQLRKKVQQLTAEVQRLKRKVSEYEKDRLASTIQEQLTKEEQRGEGLQLHLIEIAAKEEPLQTRLDEINIQLRPDNIERALAGIGSVHPENAREDLRRKLLGESQRLMYQLQLFRQDRVRTQASLATTDAAIQRLKQKLTEALRPY